MDYQDDLASLLARMDPETLASLGIIPEEQGQLAQQMQRANALRSVGAPQGQMVSGRYVKAPPLEMLGSFAERFSGEKQAHDIQGQQADLLRQKAAVRAAYLRALAGTTPQPGPMGAGDMPVDPSQLLG